MYSVVSWQRACNVRISNAQIDDLKFQLYYGWKWDEHAETDSDTAATLHMETLNESDSDCSQHDIDSETESGSIHVSYGSSDEDGELVLTIPVSERLLITAAKCLSV